LTDAGELRLLIGIENHRVVEALLQLVALLLELAEALLEAVEALPLGVSVEGSDDMVGFAVETLSADAALACQSWDFAVAAEVDGVGTGNSG
jgi:hypothetical protein